MNPIKLGVCSDPWEGEYYKEKICGHRLLILGESHYHGCDERACKDAENRSESHRNMTWSVVNAWKDAPHSSPLSNLLPAMFGLEKARFWERVAFYNYLQGFAGTKAGDRPKAHQWADASNFAAFQTVLNAMRPDRILVLGKGTWQNMPGAPGTLSLEPVLEPRLRVAEAFGKTSKGEEVACWYHFTSGRALAMPIYHPASRKFDWKVWVQPITSLLRDY